MKTSIIIIIAFLFSCSGNELNSAPTDLSVHLQKDEVHYFAEVIVIEDINFTRDLENLTHNNSCINPRSNLILDYTDKSGYLLLWQTNIKNMIHILSWENKKLYITYLNDQTIYIVFRDETELGFQVIKTGERIDLSEYLEHNFLVAHELSYWFLKLKNEGGLEIVHEVLIYCGK